jgi:hypothetical protein
LAAVWVLLPFWEAKRGGERRTRLATGLGVFLVFYLIVFTILGYVK